MRAGLSVADQYAIAGRPVPGVGHRKLAPVRIVGDQRFAGKFGRKHLFEKLLALGIKHAVHSQFEPRGMVAFGDKSAARGAIRVIVRDERATFVLTKNKRGFFKHPPGAKPGKVIGQK